MRTPLRGVQTDWSPRPSRNGMFSFNFTRRTACDRTMRARRNYAHFNVPVGFSEHMHRLQDLFVQLVAIRIDMLWLFYSLII